MTSKTILILGGGVGGIVAANSLRRRLPSGHRVVVVERNAVHSFAPSFLWLMTGDRKPEQCRRPLKSLLREGVELITASANALDLPGRKVATDAGEIAFDYLVIALGAELAPQSIPGLAESSETFFTADGAVRLRQKLESFRGGRIAFVVASMPYKCPAAPHEGAMLAADYFQRRGIRHKVEIHLFTPESQPMPVAGPQLGQAVRQLLQSKGIEFHPLHSLISVDTAAGTLVFSQSAAGPFDLIIAIPPHHAPQLLRQTSLVNAAGWVPANPRTLETSAERVYGIGDVTALPIPGRWKTDTPLLLPKAGVFAHAQAEVAAARIAAEIEGGTPEETFGGDGYCMLEAGGGIAGFAAGNFYAEPTPDVRMQPAGKSWHMGKVLLERWWLASPGWKRESYAVLLRACGKMRGIRAAV
ncbi:MAG: NAD(P)/FAD-dependent oxidoreductase [Candidatus Solibacter usitatus]|nr:NAD(P)/FAD-dependent oxidoreductase [Candidatus Solibacter usitatus]